MVISGVRVGFYHVAFDGYQAHCRPFDVMRDGRFHLILQMRIYERAEREYARREVRRKERKKANEMKRKALEGLKKEMEKHDNRRGKR